MPSLSELHPYVSVTLARITDEREEDGVVREVLRGLEGVLEIGVTDEAAPGSRDVVSRRDPTIDGTIEVGFLHYVERQPPTWLAGTDVSDEINHLALVCRRGRYVSVLLSDSTRTAAVVRALGSDGVLGFDVLERISEERMNAAFLEGPARTVWLSGTHRRTTVKADSKVLTGIDLKDALDPMDDQSYYATAARARARLGQQSITVGVAHRRSGVWVGGTRSWREFRDIIDLLLAAIDDAETTGRSLAEPLPVLARPLRTAEAMAGAFDFSIRPPEVDPEADQDSEVRELLERWAYHATFEVRALEGANLETEVFLYDMLIGRLTLSVDAANPQKVIVATEAHPQPGHEAEMRELLSVCRRRSRLQIIYESGHTVSGGRVFAQRLRDFPFRSWEWGDFTNYDVHKEKPTRNNVFQPADVGRRDSLFCWVVRNWPSPAQAGGWLACDDRSMEMADFVHLDPTERVASLIHVKGAPRSRSRGVSVTPYELVTSQAIKNLRNLDLRRLGEGLQAGLEHVIGGLVWHDRRRRPDRRPFIEALERMGTNVSLRVVIVQPHLTQSAFDSVRADQQAGQDTPVVRRMRHLDWLLCGLELDARAVGASLLVVGDGTGPVSSGRRRRGSS